VDIYGLSKWVNERQLALFAAQTKALCAAARLSNVFGPRETNPHVIPEILRQFAENRGAIAVGNVKPKRDYIHVADVAQALVTIAEKAQHRFRVYNVGTGRESSVEDIIGCLSRASGRNIEVCVDPSRVRDTDRMHLLCDLSRISGDLGWRSSVTLEEGLEDLWCRVKGGASGPNATADEGGVTVVGR
jgi:UDP-glucose 4-epimerase